MGRRGKPGQGRAGDFREKMAFFNCSPRTDGGEGHDATLDDGRIVRVVETKVGPVAKFHAAVFNSDMVLESFGRPRMTKESAAFSALSVRGCDAIPFL